MKNLISKIAAFFTMLALLQSCYPGGAEYTSDLDIAVSQFSSQEDLQGYKTYYLFTDSMAIVGNSSDVLTQPEQAIIINNTDDLLQNKLGLSKITTPTAENSADLYIYLTQIAVQQSGAIWNPPIYPGYPGWGYPGYPGWGYPGYGGGYTYYSYSNGTILVDFVDVKKTIAENEGKPDEQDFTLILGWQGALNSVLSRSNNVPLVNEGISVLFDQYNTAKSGSDN
ncbi:DUF4136 domain-containing protein [Flammeovirga yaeyamensis]|uniref:DUF4136 domain-containing protein n=1 Tax=Flammeovirga yaeyamensis TaxID=367791 RepID=A0AAX1N6G3_9BACT|nr:DUF4136 domain-containing protein [Flammeovirga yaeyamensis]MBB3700596.1 hypothetical protein [Flammeovirga yaeyamensis]NMF37712.1 DUF4136 domain-containing protein [Flammeovirga yaeyamensis]QWG02021.1 DUF4136 domain-containing protein [Flammeovirga yaeyamensis]